MDRSRLALRALVVAMCLLASRTAQADPAAQARFHDEIARSEYKKGRFESALREFFLEQRVSPNPRIAFNIALCFQELKRDQEAFHYFSQYLASDDTDPERRAYAERTVEALNRTLARVRVESAPPGASIYVDRKELGSYGQTPSVIAIAPGEHEVFVELAGYRSASGKVVAKAGEQVTLALAGSRIVGQLRVTSAQAGQLVVRGASGEIVQSGALPFDAKLPPGTYELGVTARGHLPWSGVAGIEADKTVDVVAVPQLAPARTGDITVTSNVPGAVVELNGQPIGFAPTVLSGIPVGKQRLRLRAPSMLSWSGDVVVAPEERSWLTVSLEKQASVQRSSASWIIGGIGAGTLVVGGVFAGLAAQAHSDFENAAPGTDLTVLRDRGVTLNTIATATLITGAVALATGVVLYFATAKTSDARSSASLARSKR
jgi:outer membrane receptor for ferrienterochelin and colicins